MRRASHDVGDRVRDVLGGQRRRALVDLVGLLLVTLEADQRELGLDHARSHLADADRLAEQLEAERAGDRVRRVLRGRVAGAAGIDLDAGHRADHDDVTVPAALQRGEEGLGHPHHAHHVRLVHLPPVLLVGLGDRLQPECAAGVVDHHGDLREALGELRDRVRVGDVEPQRAAADLAGHLLAALDAPGRGDDLEACGGERAHRRLADAAAGAGHQRHPASSRSSIRSYRGATARVPLIGSLAGPGRS